MHFFFNLPYIPVLPPNSKTKILKEFSTKLLHLTEVTEVHTTKHFSCNVNK